MYFRSVFVAMKWNLSRGSSCLLYFITLQSSQWTVCLILRTSLIAINTSKSHANFSFLRRALQLFGTKCDVFFWEKISHACRVNLCYKYYKYNYTLRCMKTTVRILRFFRYDYFEDLFASITFAKKLMLVSKIFAIENAWQSKDRFLRYAYRKSYLLRHLTTTIAHKNLILEIGYTYYAISRFLPKSTVYNFFPKVNSFKTYCVYFFLSKLKFSRASRHLISFARLAVC